MPRDSFRCCVITDEDAKRWFVYFDKPRSTMVVTDGMTLFYEKLMTTQERIEFAGHVSESILEDAWLETVIGKMLNVSDVTDEKLTLIHVVYKIELNRVKDENVQLRTVDLLERAINAHLRLLDRHTKNRMGIPVHMAARKTMPNQTQQRDRRERQQENGSAMDPSKRRRTRPRGLDFDDH